MKENKFLSIAEYASIAGSALGTIAAVTKGQIAYAATPMALAIFLNAINRHRFQQQMQLHTKNLIASVHQKVDFSPVERSLKKLEQEIEVLNEKFNTRSETQSIPHLTKQLNALEKHINNLPNLENLNGMQAELLAFGVQLQAIDTKMSNDSIQLKAEITSIRQQIQKLPLPSYPADKQRISQQEQSNKQLLQSLSNLQDLLTEYAKKDDLMNALDKLRSEFYHQFDNSALENATAASMSIDEDDEWMQTVDLKVPYSEKDEAKRLGAKWDVERRVWCVPPGVDIELFRRWLP